MINHIFLKFYNMHANKIYQLLYNISKRYNINKYNVIKINKNFVFWCIRIGMACFSNFNNLLGPLPSIF